MKQFRGSLILKFVILLISSICLMIFSIVIYNMEQSRIRMEHQQQVDVLLQKGMLIEDFEKSIYEVYFVISDNRKSISSTRTVNFFELQTTSSEVNEILIKLNQLEDNEEAINLLVKYTESYFNERFADIMSAANENDFEKMEELLVDIEPEESLLKITSLLNEYKQSIEEKIINVFQNHETEIKVIENKLWLFNSTLLIILLVAAIYVLIQTVRPLRYLTIIANKVTNDEVVEAINITKKNNEIGLLTEAFEKMIFKLQENEQNLLAQNEELIAQQSELKMQQGELAQTLDEFAKNSDMLVRKNEFVESLSKTLNRQELLNSVITQLAEITFSNKGFIVTVPSLEFSVYGMTAKQGIRLVNKLDDSLFNIVKEKNEPYLHVWKSETTDSFEGMYHTEELIISDYYVPVMAFDGTISALILLTKMGVYSQFEQRELNNFIKQISLSLDNVMMYEEAKNQRRMTKDIMNTIKEGIMLIEPSGNIKVMNRALSNLTSITIDDEQQLPLQLFYEKLEERIENFEAFMDYFNDRVFAHADTKNIEHIAVTKNTEPKIYKVYCEMLTDHQKALGYIFVFRDITKEYESEKMKNEFVSTVSHELRTPLSSILGFSEIMLSKELKAERQNKYLQNIYKEAGRLTSLVNEFLDIQRMESGSQVYEKEEVNIVDLLSEVVEMQKVNSRIHHIQLIIPAQDLFVLGDNQKLVQVFNNLLSNAIKYSPNGGDIVIYFEQTEGAIKCAIKDHGLGIPSESIPNLFQKFYRVDNSDRRKIGGTGLGLAIVKEIIVAHDGTIDVQSEVGEGSTFTVSLPSLNKVTEQQEDVETNIYSPEIVLVEDDLSLAMLLKDELDETGFNVVHFNNGEETIEYILKYPPRLVIVDIMLHKQKSGWTVIERMKSHPKLKETPIIISSAYEDWEKAKKLEIDNYLLKPYRPSKLSATIISILSIQIRDGSIYVPKNAVLDDDVNDISVDFHL